MIFSTRRKAQPAGAPLRGLRNAADVRLSSCKVLRNKISHPSSNARCFRFDSYPAWRVRTGRALRAAAPAPAGEQKSTTIVSTMDFIRPA